MRVTGRTLAGMAQAETDDESPGNGNGRRTATATTATAAHGDTATKPGTETARTAMATRRERKRRPRKRRSRRKRRREPPGARRVARRRRVARPGRRLIRSRGNDDAVRPGQIHHHLSDGATLSYVRRLGASIRVRIVIGYLVLIAVALTVTIVIARQVQAARIDSEVESGLVEQAQEFRRVAGSGTVRRPFGVQRVPQQPRRGRPRGVLHDPARQRVRRRDPLQLRRPPGDHRGRGAHPFVGLGRRGDVRDRRTPRSARLGSSPCP